ncbi:MAG: hypothetical protein KDC44_12250 [Phaeodactylibacter sp.]|nr:hypothetical protein [Phaeodactylibacter sp.]
METLIFEPHYSGINGTVGIAALGLVLGALGLWIGIRKEWKRKDRQAYKPLVALLSFIVVLLCAGTVVFSLLAREKLVQVTLTEDALTTQFGTVAVRAIRNAFIETDVQPHFFNPVGSDTTYLLVIEEMSGKAHVLSSENYDIEGILKGLKARR